MSVYGVDVAVLRADDLDKRMIANIQKKDNPSVLDVGCGAGGQSLRLATAGASVFGTDVCDFEDVFITLRNEHGFSEKTLEFVCGDIEQFEAVIKHRIFDDCCFQRAIHYLPYKTAAMVLKKLGRHISDGLYISVTGLESAIGEQYEDKAKPVAQRFCALGAQQAETFDIHAPLCLYTKLEFEGLLKESGWVVEECWVSAFGNIKAICRQK